MAGLFISYRREDSAPYAGRLYDRLSRDLAEHEVFIDIDTIDPGDDFVEVINARLDSCNAVIALIGRSWTTSTDRTGARRLDNPDDYIRKEIATALSRKVRVIPVLVGGAEMPRSTDLPDDLKPLSRRNAIELRDTRFHGDVDRLIETLRRTTAPVTTAQSAGSPQPTPSIHAEDRDRPQTSRTEAAPAELAAGSLTPLAGRGAEAQTPHGIAPRGLLRTRKSPLALAALVAGFIAIAVFITGAIFWAMRPDTVDVPDVIGKTVQEARLAITAAGFAVREESSTENENAAEGTVIEQKPAPGRQTDSDGSIAIVVARVPQTEIPNIVGEKLEQAKILIAGRGLVLGSTETKESSDRPPGEILEQRPSAGTHSRKGETVDLVVAVAPSIVVPDVRGQPLSQARSALTAAGARIGRVEYRKSSKMHSGLVLDQRPAPGQKLETGGKVQLVLAALVDVEVPNTVGWPLSKARAALEKVGLAAGEIKKAGLHDNTEMKEPLVRAQFPLAAAQVKVGDAVNLVVAEPGVRVPDLARMPLERARLLLESAGLAVGDVNEARSRSVSAGSVVKQSPGADKLVAKGFAITLTVAAEPPVKKLAMPDFVGAPRAAAIERLHSMGVRNITSKPVQNADAKPDEVLKQIPDPRSSIATDTAVTLQYAARIKWINAPGKISSSDDARAYANEHCPKACLGIGGKWRRQFKSGTIVSCGCDVK